MTYSVSGSAFPREKLSMTYSVSGSAFPRVCHRRLSACTRMPHTLWEGFPYSTLGSGTDEGVVKEKIGRTGN